MTEISRHILPSFPDDRGSNPEATVELQKIAKYCLDNETLISKLKGIVGLDKDKEVLDCADIHFGIEYGIYSDLQSPALTDVMKLKTRKGLEELAKGATAPEPSLPAGLPKNTPTNQR